MRQNGDVKVQFRTSDRLTGVMRSKQSVKQALKMADCLFTYMNLPENQLFQLDFRGGISIINISPFVKARLKGCRMHWKPLMQGGIEKKNNGNLQQTFCGVIR